MSADVARVCSSCSDELFDGARSCASCGCDTIERACNACGVILQAGQMTCPACRPPHDSEVTDDIFGPERRRTFDDLTDAESLRDDSVWTNLAEEYQPVCEIRRSPRSIVYQADDLMRNRTVAIEILAPDRITGPAHAERFLKEAKALIPAKHAHVHGVFAVRQIDEAFLLVMANIDGGPLSDLAAEQPIASVDMVHALATQLGSALDYLQSRDIVHGDIRPETIWIRPDGDALLTDFAFRADRAEAGDSDGKAANRLPAPERMWESDQYALGEVLYTMLTGAPPYAPLGSGVPALFLHREPKPIREFRSDCPPAFDAMILRMLSVQPSDRFPSMSRALSTLSSTTAGASDVFGNVSIGWTSADSPTPNIDAQTDVGSIADIEFIELESSHQSGTSVSPTAPPAPPVVVAPKTPASRPSEPPGLALVEPRSGPTTTAPVFARPVKQTSPDAAASTTQVAPAAPLVAAAEHAAPVVQVKPAPAKTTATVLPTPKKESHVGRSIGLLLTVGLAGAFFGRDHLPFAKSVAVTTSRPMSTYFAADAQAAMFRAGFGIGSPAAADDFTVSSKDPKLLIVDGRVSLAPSALAYGQNSWRADGGNMAVHFDVWFDRAPGPHEGGIVLRTLSGEHLFVHLLQSKDPRAAVSVRGSKGDALLVSPTPAPALRAGMNAVDLVIVNRDLTLLVNGAVVITSHTLPSAPNGQVGIFGSASTGVEFDNLAIANLTRR